MDPIIADEMRRRSAMFWGRRAVVGSWPIEPKDFIFLGNAVHLVGEALFDDWYGNEPAFSRYPELDGLRRYRADGFDAVFASWVLQNYDPTIADDFMQTVEQRWTRSADPLTDEQWEKAIELFKEKVSGFQKLARYRMAKVVRTITEAAAREELHLFTRSFTGEFRPSPSSLWCVEQPAYARFNECQMSPSTPHSHLVPHIYDIAMPSGPPPDVLPGNEWIYAERASFTAYLQSLRGDKVGGAQPPPVPNTSTETAPDNLLVQMSATHRAIGEAVAALWPDGRTPAFSSVKDRNDLIFNKMKELTGKTTKRPDDVTFRRFFKKSGLS